MVLVFREILVIVLKCNVYSTVKSPGTLMLHHSTIILDGQTRFATEDLSMKAMFYARSRILKVFR